VNQYNSELLTKLDQWFDLEGCNIISDNSAWIARPCHNIFKKTNDYFVRSAPCGDNFYPLGEIICCS
jgi:hypothetical protein